MHHRCPACDHSGNHDGPTHAYMSPSAACWARYGEVLAREFSDRRYFASHRRLVDAYCGHHSIGDDRRARQSLHIHLAGLMLHFEDGADDDNIRWFLSRAAEGAPDFPALTPPDESHDVSYSAVFEAKSPDEHSRAVAAYARDVFDAWSPHHDRFRALIQKTSRQ